MAALIDRAMALLRSEGFLYLAFGAATTAVNYGIFWAARDVLRVPLFRANALAWIGAVVFAYLTNKVWVFHSASWQLSVVLPEVVAFAGARLFSLGFEMAFLWATVKKLGMHEKVSKISANVLVIALNYLFSKFWIFR